MERNIKNKNSTQKLDNREIYSSLLSSDNNISVDSSNSINNENSSKNDFYSSYFDLISLNEWKLYDGDQNNDKNNYGKILVAFGKRKIIINFII